MTKIKTIQEAELDPWRLFLNAMRSPVTRDRYGTRVAKFFDFTEMPGRTLEQRAKTFAKKGKKDTNWALSNILKFIYFQRERVDKKEISDNEKKIEISKPVYAEDSTLPYLGKNHKIEVKILDSQKEKCKEEEKNSVVYKNGVFLFNIHSDIHDKQDYYEEIKKLHEDWNYRKAEIIFKEKINILNKVIGIKPNKVVIKNLRNRWASITKNNDINLNVNLIKAPPEIIDYIIIHELCHFKIKGHSYNFWNLLRRYIPDYPKFVEWLNINGKNLLS